MREIKFRAWTPAEDDEPGYMISGDDLAFEEYLPVTDLLSQEGIMQYTGLKDKNGKEIFEGDILAYKNIDNFSCDFIVNFSAFRAGWLAQNEYEIYDLLPSKFDSAEVIGNIYENKNLLQD